MLHGLTQRLLRNLIRNDGYEQVFCCQLYRHAGAEVSLSEGLERIIPSDELALLQHLVHLISGFKDLTLEMRKELRLGYGLAAIVRGMSQAVTFETTIEILPGVFPGFARAFDRWNDVDPDMARAYCEWLTLLYKSGGLTQSVGYMNKFGELAALAFDDATSAEERVSLLLDLASAHIAFESYDEPNGILALIQASITESEGISANLAGDLWLLCGELASIYGWYVEARQLLRDALDLYGQISNPLMAVRTVARAYQALVETCLGSGASAEDCVNLCNEIVEYRVSLKDRVVDQIGAARLALAEVRLRTRLLMDDYVELGSLKGLMGEVQKIAGFYDSVNAQLIRSGILIEITTCFLETGTIKLLANYLAYRSEVKELMVYAFEYGHDYSAMKLGVLLYKALLYYDAWALEPATLDAVCDALTRTAYACGIYHSAPYWYAEASALVCITRAISGGLPDLVVQATTECYQEIGRGDRLIHLEKVLCSVSEQNVGDFRENMRNFFRY